MIIQAEWGYLYESSAPRTPRALQAVGTGVLVGLRYFWRTAAFYGKYNGYYIDTPPRDFSAWQSARIGLGAR